MYSVGDFFAGGLSLLSTTKKALMKTVFRAIVADMKVFIVIIHPLHL